MSAKLNLLLAFVVLPVACLARVDSKDSVPVDRVDAGDDANPAPVDGGTGSVGTEAPGLWVEGKACSSIQTDQGYRTWPDWAVSIRASCGAMGLVRVFVEGRADVPYPQQCSVVTSVSLGFDVEGDAGSLYWIANSSRGTCKVFSGPNLVQPATPIHFEATVQNYFDASKSRSAKYVAEPK